MAPSTHYPQRVSVSNPCPVCKKADKCMVGPSHDDPEIVVCMREPVHNGKEAYKTKEIDSIGTGYYHRLRDKVGFSKEGPRRSKKLPKSLTTTADQESSILSTDVAPEAESEKFPQSEALSISPEDVDLRNRVYSRLVERCPLTEQHRRDNAARGFDPKALGYGSLPGSTGRIVSELLAEFPNLSKVPGFVEKEPGKIVIHAGAGLLVPSRNRLGEIVRLDRRHPSPKPKGNKWVPLSGGEHYNGTAGASVGAPLHLARVPDDSGIVIITEGTRKADTIAAKIPGVGVVSVPGVGSWKAAGLVEELDAVGCKVARIAYDADAKDNPHVARSALQLANALEESGLVVEFAVWGGEHKGMDDALLAGVKPSYLAGDEATQHREALAKRHGLNPDGTKPDDPRPKFNTGSPQDELLDGALGLLVEDPHFFLKNAAIVQPICLEAKAKSETESPVGPVKLVSVEPPGIAARLAQLAQWVKYVTRRNGDIVEVVAGVPDWLSKRVSVCAGAMGYKGPRGIVGVLNGPTMDTEGNLINTPGYCTIDGNGWYLASPVEGLDIPEKPSHAQCQMAVERIRKAVKFYPWATDLDFIKWVTGLITAVLRPMVDTTPFLLISANRAGSGKSYLMRTIGMIAHGAEPPIAVWPDHPEGRDDELRKRFAGLVNSGATLATLDNLPDGADLVSPVTCSFVTATIFEDRLMKQNAGAVSGGVNRLLLIGNGNNIHPASDLADRTLLVQLDFPGENPRGRALTEFGEIGDGVEYCKDPDNRRELLAAVLTIARGYIRHGRPDQPGESWGAFVDFCRLPVNAVRWATGQDPLADRKKIISNDPKAAALKGLLRAWWTLFNTQWVSPGRLLKMTDPFHDAPEAETIREALAELGRAETAQGIGRILKRVANRTEGGMRLTRRTGDDGESGEYCLKRITPEIVTLSSKTEEIVTLPSDPTPGFPGFPGFYPSTHEIHPDENIYVRMNLVGHGGKTPGNPGNPGIIINQSATIPKVSDQSATNLADRDRNRFLALIPPGGIPRKKLEALWAESGGSAGDYAALEFAVGDARRRGDEVWIHRKSAAGLML